MSQPDSENPQFTENLKPFEDLSRTNKHIERLTTHSLTLALGLQAYRPQTTKTPQTPKDGYHCPCSDHCQEQHSERDDGSYGVSAQRPDGEGVRHTGHLRPYQG